MIERSPGGVCCVSGCADLHLLDMLSPMERKRQGYIHELIVTEENYVNDLQLVTEVKNTFFIVCSSLTQHIFVVFRTTV